MWWAVNWPSETCRVTRRRVWYRGNVGFSGWPTKMEGKKPRFQGALNFCGDFVVGCFCFFFGGLSWKKQSQVYKRTCFWHLWIQYIEIISHYIEGFTWTSEYKPVGFFQLFCWCGPSTSPSSPARSHIQISSERAFGPAKIDLNQLDDLTSVGWLNLSSVHNLHSGKLT